MGYFANGTEGALFEEAWCSRCVHYEGCPVWMLHLLWSGEQHPEYEKTDAGKAAAETKREALDMLIDRGEDRLTNRCQMFAEKTPAPSPHQLALAELRAEARGDAAPVGASGR